MHGRGVLPGPAAKLGAAVVLHRLHDLGLRVHHKGAVLHHRLGDGAVSYTHLDVYKRQRVTHDADHRALGHRLPGVVAGGTAPGDGVCAGVAPALALPGVDGHLRLHRLSLIHI